MLSTGNSRPIIIGGLRMNKGCVKMNSRSLCKNRLFGGETWCLRPGYFHCPASQLHFALSLIFETAHLAECRVQLTSLGAITAI